MFGVNKVLKIGGYGHAQFGAPLFKDGKVLIVDGKCFVLFTHVFWFNWLILIFLYFRGIEKIHMTMAAKGTAFYTPQEQEM